MNEGKGEHLRIAAFGFRSYPPRAGSAGADKFASELLPRLAALGHKVTAYNRFYSGVDEQLTPEYVDGVHIVSFRTVRSKGFDTLMHSAKATFDIIKNNRAELVHIQNGGNSIFGAILRVFGKKTFLSQDGLDWEREKWSWYARLFLYISSYVTAHVHTAVIFDNVFAREAFQKRFKKEYDFIPFGADVHYEDDGRGKDFLRSLGLEPESYFLFVGRFIADKGLHWLVPAFENVATGKKLVLVGGSPNPSPYENEIRATPDQRIVFPGFVYGQDVHTLMRHAYAYVQPSVIEGLSPVILEAAFLGAPIICSDLPQNQYAMGKHALYFRSGDTKDLVRKLRQALEDPVRLSERGLAGSDHVAKCFAWDTVVEQHVGVFQR